MNGAAAHASELRMILLPPQRMTVCLKHTSKYSFTLNWCDYRDFPCTIYSLHVHHLWCEVCVAFHVYIYIKSFASFSALLRYCAAALVLGCRDPASPLTAGVFFSMADLLTWHISSWFRCEWGHLCVLAEGCCSHVPVFPLNLHQWIILTLTFCW